MTTALTEEYCSTGLLIEWGGDGPGAVLQPAGVIDSATVWMFREAIADVPPATPLVVDLARVTFMDSAGLGALIGGIRRVRHLGGDVALASPRRSIARVLQTTGIDRISPVFDTVGAAAAACRAGLSADKGSDPALHL